jgi:hypothetical protein
MRCGQLLLREVLIYRHGDERQPCCVWPRTPSLELTTGRRTVMIGRARRATDDPVRALLGIQRMRDAAGQLVAGAGLLSELPGLLRSPMQPLRARQILRQRLDRRGADFLRLLEHAVFSNEASPYLWLLRQAGCTYPDVARIVAQEGLEATLRALYRRGVYLTVDEMKGRRPVRRGPAALELDPAALRNPFTARHVALQTGGSRGQRTLVPLDVAWIRDRSVDICLWFEAIGGLGWRHRLRNGQSLHAQPGFGWKTPASIAWSTSATSRKSRRFAARSRVVQ